MTVDYRLLMCWFAYWYSSMSSNCLYIKTVTFLAGHLSCSINFHQVDYLKLDPLGFPNFVFFYPEFILDCMH